MTEHRCIVCPQLHHGEARIYERPNVCTPCRTSLDHTLADIPDLYATLPDQLEPGRSNGQRITGTREPPLPLRLTPLDLSLPVASGSARWATVHDPYGDQTGPIPVAVTLDQWVRDWRDTLYPTEGLPAPTVATLVSWLRHRLEDACDQHPAVDDFAADMTTTRRELRRANGTTKPHPEHLDVPCRSCDLLTLYRMPGDDRAVCQHPDCGLILTADELARWIGLLASHYNNRPAQDAQNRRAS